MWRRDRFWGIFLLGFGLGLLGCCWVETQFWRICLGIMLCCGGVLLCGKK